MNHKIKFYYNGLKIDGGKLQRGHYSFQESREVRWGGQIKTIPTQMTFYGKDYIGFSPEVWETFTVENNSDSMTDYFEQDRIRILPDHPHFKDAADGYVKQQQRMIKRLGPDQSEQESKDLAEFITAYIENDQTISVNETTHNKIADSIEFAQATFDMMQKEILYGDNFKIELSIHPEFARQLLGFLNDCQIARDPHRYVRMPQCEAGRVKAEAAR